MNLIQKLIVLAFFLLTTIACGGGESNTEEQEETTEEQEETTEEQEETTEEQEVDMSSDEAKMLVKTWKMTEFIHEKGETEKAQEEDLLMLNADGTYTDMIEGKEQESGTWKLSEDKKEIVFKVEKGEFMGANRKITIKELTEDKLVVDDGKIVETFVPAETSSEEETEESAE